MDHHDLIRQGPPRAVESRFELAAVRLAERWLASGRMTVSSDDMKITRDFLEQVGCHVRELPGVLIRIEDEHGHVEEMSREGALLLAFRRLVACLRDGRSRRLAR